VRAPASIAALADAFVVLLNTTRVHVTVGSCEYKANPFRRNLQQPPAAATSGNHVMLRDVMRDDLPVDVDPDVWIREGSLG
jgi:hypothetical protein